MSGGAVAPGGRPRYLTAMLIKAILVLLCALAFAASPLFVTDFGGYDPSQFPVPLTDPSVQPAGYAFSIWGPIYLWLIVMAGYGVWKRQDDPAWDATRMPLIVSLAVGAIWLSVAVASPIWATILIVVMLASALVALSRTPETDLWLLRAPIGLYAGWLTAASAVSLGLLTAGYGVPPFGETGWAIAALIVGLGVAVAMIRVRASLMYGVALVWALTAVFVRNGADFVGLFALLAAVGIAVFALRALKRARG